MNASLRAPSWPSQRRPPCGRSALIAPGSARQLPLWQSSGAALLLRIRVEAVADGNAARGSGRSGGGGGRSSGDRSGLKPKPGASQPSSQPSPPPPHASHPSQMHAILTGAGARRVVLPSRKEAESRGQEVQVFQLESVEVFALVMSALRHTDDTVPFAFFKPARRILARALLGDLDASGTRAELKQMVARGRGRPSLKAAYWPISPALAWVEAVRSQPSWRQLGPVLRRVVDADPRPRPQTKRKGFAAEAWALQQLHSSAASVGWQIHGSAKRTDVPTVKGVKGEADALLVDPAGLCQGVVEIKIGSANPYNALYDDLRKLRRMMDDLAGGEAVFEVPPPPLLSLHTTHMMSTTSTTDGSGSTRPAAATPGGEVRVVSFAGYLAPVYLVVADDGGARMEGEAALAQAEASLLRINVSMSLGGASEWVRGGCELLEVDSLTAQVRVRGPLVAAMRRRVADKFFDTLESCTIYQLERPPGAKW